MPEPLVGVVGRGRLGRAVLEGCAEQGLPVVLTASTDGWMADAVPDVLIDASAPAAQDAVLKYCQTNEVALIECVSDVDAEQWTDLEDLAAIVPVLRATNLAVGHFLQSRLVEHLAAFPLRHPFVPETSVWERHPATKAHRPSATAVALADTWVTATGTAPVDVSSLRSGLAVSEHEITWTWGAETLSLRHGVGSFAAAAQGAVAAVRWLHGREPGLVGTRDLYEDLMGMGHV
jgi:4-hydroxy-tetrahydrodipicolinate reductase